MRPIISALCAFVASLFQSRWAMPLKPGAQLAGCGAAPAPEARPSDRPVGLLAPVAGLATGAGVRAAPTVLMAKEAMRDDWRGV